jgi:hypothetical protein
MGGNGSAQFDRRFRSAEKPKDLPANAINGIIVT